MISIYPIKKLAQLTAQNYEDTPIYFLGVDYKNFRLASVQYPHLQHLRDEREKMLDLYSQNLINFDPAIPGLHDPLWLSSDLAENNLCLEDFSLYILNSLSLIEKISGKDMDILLVCDNDEQVLVYSHILNNNGFNVQSKVHYGVLLKKILGLLWGKISTSFDSLRKVAMLKCLRIHYKTPLKLSFLKGAKVLCINWIGPHSFSPETLLLKDKYFGDLLSHIDQSSIRWSLVGKSLDFAFPFYEIARNSLLNNKKTLFFQDFLSFRDIATSFFKSFLFLKYMNHPLEIGGVNFSWLWKWLCFKDSMKGRIPSALEAYYASRTFFKKMAHSQATLLYPYENQPWEKLLCLAFYEQFPQNKIFAYQHFPFAKNYLTSYPSQGYLSTSKAPTILLSDKFFGEWLKEKGCYNYTLFGNFRFQTLNDKSKEKKEAPIGELKNLLCSCSIQLNDSLELVTKTIQLLETLDAATQKSVRLVVNFHPLMAQNSKNIIKNLLHHTKFESSASDLSADELIDHSYLVFYNSNSICFNAAMRGIPAIFIKSDLLINLDRIPSVSFQINDEKNGAYLINKLLKESAYYGETSKKFELFFKSYYNPPNYKLIQELLIQ